MLFRSSVSLLSLPSLPSLSGLLFSAINSLLDGILRLLGEEPPDDESEREDSETEDREDSDESARLPSPLSLPSPSGLFFSVANSVLDGLLGLLGEADSGEATATAGSENGNGSSE